MVASLLRYFRDIDFETAEDIVQDAFSAALDHWQQVPDNPAGWIFSVCRNKVLNKLRADKKMTTLEAVPEEVTAPEAVFTTTFPDDQQLRLLFACAHPDLSPKVQVVITLKYVANFKVATIASMLGMTLDGADKILLRARQKIRDEKILLTTPAPAALKKRLPIVHKIIYLIFNEGYSTLKEGLCEEALILNKAILDSDLGDIDTCALHALMLFNASRIKARMDENGELLDLEQQNRSLWDQDLILLGSTYFEQSQGQHISSYHFEAGIAYLHSTAKSFEETDWPLIARLYHQLLAHYPNPFAELNQSIALFYAGDAEQAFHILHTLQRSPFMNSYHRLNATLGKLYMLEGKLDLAKEYFNKTLQQTPSPAETTYIRKMLDKIQYLYNHYESDQ